ncbi:PKD domain-containing protein [Aquimarina sp. AD10]|nr:PKD domain-containing protein [Aquimarina sp. AD10]
MYKSIYPLLILIIVLSCDNNDDDIIPDGPPVANAGEDITIEERSEFVLDGSKSNDPNNDIVKYEWKVIDNKFEDNINIFPNNKNDSIKNLITIPDIGEYIFELNVTDSKGESSKDTVRIKAVSIPCGIEEDISLKLLSDNSFDKQDDWVFEVGERGNSSVSITDGKLIIDSGNKDEIVDASATLNLDNLNIATNSKLYFEIDIEKFKRPYLQVSDFDPNDYLYTNIDIVLFNTVLNFKANYIPSWGNDNVRPRIRYPYLDNKKVIILYDLGSNEYSVCIDNRDISYSLEVNPSSSPKNYVKIRTRPDEAYPVFFNNIIILKDLKIYTVE